MKRINLALFLLSMITVSCAKKTEKVSSVISRTTDIEIQIPDITVDLKLLDYDNQTSLWTSNNQLFSGYGVSYYQSGVLKEKISFWNGRKQNQSTLWYEDNHLKRISNYQQGRLHGMKKSWSPDRRHVLISHLNYYMGKAHGQQTFWYPSGELYKKLNLNMGKEDGMQMAFRKNGDLYANYEAKEGRIFGLKKAALCYGLEDENIKYEN